MIAATRRHGLGVAMWVAIALAVALFFVLWTGGSAQRAWNVAAGVLVVSCLAVCLWGALIGRQTDRSVRQAVARMEALRREADAKRYGRGRQGDGSD